MDLRVEIEETAMTKTDSHLSVKIRVVVHATNGIYGVKSDHTSFVLRYPLQALLGVLTRDTSQTMTSPSALTAGTAVI